MVKTDVLTIKQRKFVKHYLATGNATESYRVAGYTANTYLVAKSGGSRLLTKADVKKTMAELFDAAGLTDEALVEDIKDGTKATRWIIKDDKIVKSPDYHARHKFVRTALEVKDKIPNSKLEITGKDGRPLQFQVLAGVAFLPELPGNAQMATGGFVPEPQEVQSTDLAQESKENNYSDK